MNHINKMSKPSLVLLSVISMYVVTYGVQPNLQVIKELVTFIIPYV